MTCTESALRPYADEAFGKLKVQFQNSSNYWQLGHSFDTIIDYLAEVNPAAALGFGQIALLAYNRSTYNACWYDDFGWWGIASLKASQHKDLFPDAFGEFANISRSCWDTMYDNAPNVWKNNQGFTEFKPRFDGGVWNADWTKAGPTTCNNMPCVPRLPSACTDPAAADNLCGIQNTVTNGLYLVLGERRYMQADCFECWDAAISEYAFLDHWFGVADIDPERALWNPVEGGAVVRERMGTYAPDDKGVCQTVCVFEPGLAWAGDQGIILGGLVDRMTALTSKSSEYQVLLQRAKAIAAGVKSQTEIKKKNPGILTAWVTETQGGDPGDYNTGVGVYWRYLLYAYQNNADLKTYFEQTGQTDFVCSNAQHITPLIGSDNFVDLTNYLAVLVAAIVMSPS